MRRKGVVAAEGGGRGGRGGCRGRGKEELIADLVPHGCEDG